MKNVVKIYDNQVPVISGLNLEIRDREFLILVGPSGCGKSTMLRMIAGLEDISSGDIYIGEQRVNHKAPKDRDIAMVFQSYALYPHMSVYKNMAFGLKLRGVGKEEIHRKVMEAARMLDIEKYLDRKPRALSGGQRQRVALGRAMVRNPAVFLLDEPLSNLDAKLRTEMRNQITRLHQTLQTTFVYVTHDQTEAMTMADRIAVMRDGELQQVDTPRKLYQEPCNRFVAGFIGTPRMNITEACLRQEGQWVTLSFGQFQTRLPRGTISEESLMTYVGKQVLMGLRPEDFITLDSHRYKEGDGHLRALVDVAEQMGSETYLYITVNGERMIARVSSRIDAQVGDQVELAVDSGKIHLFDRETEQRIT